MRYRRRSWTSKSSARSSTKRPSRGELPADFELDVLDPPPEDVAIPLEAVDGGQAGRVAVGVLVALDDANGDGQFTMTAGFLEDGDEMFGVSWTSLVLYVFEPPGAGAGLAQANPFLTNPDAATPGFHVGHNLCVRSDTGETIPGEGTIGIDEDSVSLQTHFEIDDDRAVRIYLVEPVNHFPKEHRGGAARALRHELRRRR